MIKYLLMIIASVAALLATPAAACQFDGQRNVQVGPMMGDASSVGSASMTALLERLWTVPGIDAQIAAAGCTRQEVTQKVIEINGNDPARMLPFSGLFAYPVLATGTSAPAVPQPVETSAPAEVAAPVAEPEAPAAPVVAAPLAVQPLPERVNVSDIRAAISSLQQSNRQIRSELNAIPESELTPEHLTLLNQLNAIPGLVALLQDLPADENGVVEVATLPAPQQAAVQQVIAAQSLAEEYLGRETLDWMTVTYAPIILLLLVLGILGYRSLSARIDKKANDEALNLFSANVAGLTNRMGAAEADIADVRAQGGFRVITLEPGWREKVMAIEVGVAVDLSVIGDGDAFATIVAERGVDDNIFITAGIDDQNARNAIKIDNLLTTVRKAAKPDEKKGGKIRLNNLVNRLQAVS